MSEDPNRIDDEEVDRLLESQRRERIVRQRNIVLIVTGVQVRYLDLFGFMSFKNAVTVHNWTGFALIANFFVWLFFYLFGFPGIALGTAVSHLLGCVVVLGMLARGRAGLWLRWRLLRPDWALLWRLLRVGVPAGVDSM